MERTYHQEKNILMVLLYIVLANSSGSCSLTADIISSIWLKENKTKWLNFQVYAQF